MFVVVLLNEQEIVGPFETEEEAKQFATIYRGSEWIWLNGDAFKVWVIREMQRPALWAIL